MWLKAVQQILFSTYCGREKSRAFSFGLHRSDWAYKWEKEGVGRGSKQGLTQSQEGEKLPKAGRRVGSCKCGCVISESANWA